MRQVMVLVVGVALAGCAELRDAFSARPGNVARAAGQTLSVERLAELSARAKQLPLKESNLSQLAGAYVDYVLFVDALAHGQALEDSTLIAATMWPVISQQKFNRFVAQVPAGQTLSDAQVDSAYRAGEVRAFQHILIGVPVSAAPPVVKEKEAQINGLWHRLEASRGRNFATVARQTSEDAASRASGGYLDVGGRGRFVKQFEDTAWRLPPGAMSGVVRTSFGFHIIRRPPLAEIRDTFAAGVRRLVLSAQDSSYFADLAASKDIQLSSGASGAVRSAAQNLGAASGSDKTLARYKGGTFTVADLARWLYALDPRIARQIPTISDSLIRVMVRQLVERSLALRQADSAHIDLTADEWADVRTEYDSTLKILRTLLGVDSLPPAAATAGVADREREMVALVDGYFDRVVAGQAQFLPVPPLLGLELRRRNTWSIDPAAVQRAVERAQTLRASADSLRQRDGMRPAPGPAPLPATPPSDSTGGVRPRRSSP